MAHAIVTPCVSSSCAQHLLRHLGLNPDWLYLSGTGLPRLSCKKRPLNGGSSSGSSSSSCAVTEVELSMGPFCVTQSIPTHQLTEPTQPNPIQVEKVGPNPTKPGTTNNRAYSLVVTYFYTQNLSVSGTGQIGRKIKFNYLVKPNLI